MKLGLMYTLVTTPSAATFTSVGPQPGVPLSTTISGRSLSVPTLVLSLYYLIESRIARLAPFLVRSTLARLFIISSVLKWSPRDAFDRY